MHARKNYTVEDYYDSFQKGEENGFNYFFQQLYEPLLHFAYSFVKSRESAEDIVEDSFVKLWEKRQSIESAAGLKPYLYSMVRNRCLNLLRKQLYERTYEMHVLGSPVEYLPDVTEKITRAEAMHRVFLALEKLPPKCREVFKLIFLQGKEVKEIARDLDISVSTVKNHKAKALELLRGQFPYLGCLLLFSSFNL